MKFIFIHINKTAGSSVEQALGLRFRHLTAAEVIAQIGMDAWRQAYTFTFVRNPWDKVVSHFHYRILTNQTDMGTEPLSFKDWVRLAYGDRDPRYYDKPKMFMPQTDWITDDNGEVLVNFIGRFERLADDFRQVCRHINRSGQLPHLKRSGHDDYRRYYDDVSREIVADWFRKDIERFDYSFD